MGLIKNAIHTESYVSMDSLNENTSMQTGISYFGITVIKLILILTLVCHWSGCGLFFIAKLEGFSEDTWIGRFDPTLQVDISIPC